ncbi:MAG: hypothetical protein RLO46_14455, partial [Pseudomonadales bacterium]
SAQLARFAEPDRRGRLETTIDAVIDRFGEGAVRRARDVSGRVVGQDAPTLDYLDEGDDEP